MIAEEQRRGAEQHGHEDDLDAGRGGRRAARSAGASSAAPASAGPRAGAGRIHIAATTRR